MEAGWPCSLGIALSPTRVSSYMSKSLLTFLGAWICCFPDGVPVAGQKPAMGQQCGSAYTAVVSMPIPWRLAHFLQASARRALSEKRTPPSMWLSRPYSY